MRKERLYSVRVDGFEICEIVLEHDQYKDQHSRDIVRRDISVTYSVPTHYIRLHHKEGQKIVRTRK